jgi:hypothetical protein
LTLSEHATHEWQKDSSAEVPPLYLYLQSVWRKVCTKIFFWQVGHGEKVGQISFLPRV